MLATRGTLAIREIAAHDDRGIASAVELYGQAYPVLKLDTATAVADAAGRTQRRLSSGESRLFLAERDGTVAGTMMVYDYLMRLRDGDVAVAGLGSVAVGLAHKRRGVAKALVSFHLDDARARGAAFSILHPFRADFYRALGYGYGTPTQRYRFAAGTLRTDGAQGSARLLTVDDAGALVACTERVRTGVNGLLAKSDALAQRLLGEPQIRYVGIEDAGGVLRAYAKTMVVLGPEGSVNTNELLVSDIAYEHDAAFAALLAYLRAQEDQYPYVAVEVQDPAFYLVSTDARDGTDTLVGPPATHRIAQTGLGIMYRVTDMDAAFERCGAGAMPLTLRLVVADSFSAPTRGTFTYRFVPGRAPERDDAAEADVTLAIAIADLSSLVAGSHRLRDLIRHRLASVVPESQTARLAALFEADPPVCTTRF